MESGFRQWNIRVEHSLGKDRPAVSVLAGQGGRLVGIDLQRPQLEGPGGDARLEFLHQGDVIEQPVSAGVVQVPLFFMVP